MKNQETMDMITSLPGCIMDNILVRLPLEEAVRTSILSREWRYKWKSIPNLVFDFRYSEIWGQYNTKVEAIYHILRHHRGDINKFHLNWVRSADIEEWVRLLSSSQVHDFKLCIFDDYSAKHGLTSPFFAFENLKQLCLHCCIFKPPPEFKGFCKLVTLDFEQVEYVPEDFHHFLSQSPLLETLKVSNCTDLDAFEVQGPRLRSFTFGGVLKTICFKKSPFLTQVSVSFPGCLTFRNFPPMMETLHLSPCAVELTSAGGDVLNRLIFLELVVNVHNIKEVGCVFCLIRSSPNIQSLRLTLFTPNFKSVETVVREFIRAQHVTNPYLQQLRKVDIKFYNRRDYVMDLIRYLLASAVRLEEIVISTLSCTLSEEDMNQLKQLPRASTTVRAFVKNKLDVCIPF